MKDWTGNKNSIYKQLAASNHCEDEREENDYYATDPKSVEELLKNEKFFPRVWEPACGGGHISDVLKKHGYTVRSSDIIDRGYEGTEILDFLNAEPSHDDYDIITNPPYKYAQEFLEKAMEVLPMDGAMFLKLTFLEGQARREMFKKYPPKTIYVFSSRAICAKNGEFDKIKGSAVAYARFVWEKGFNGNPIIKWVN